MSVKSEELFSLLVSSVRDYAIFMLDPHGNVATWNAGASRIKGWTADEIIGKHFSTFYPEADVRAGKCEMELEVAARDGVFEDEGWRVRKDGSEFWANVVITAVRDASGTLIGFAKVTRDLTDRKRGEEERAARLAAEHANRAKDEFLAMLGHELRNPLAPIATALQLMKLRGDGESKEQQVIDRQLRYMMRLVDDLLDVSRIVQGKITLKTHRLDLREVLAKALELASPMIEQRQHHLDVEAPGRFYVDGDDARLIQVISNLIVNAAKYTDHGGHIAVSIREDAATREAVIEVRDDGIGISPELLPRVFDLFVQGYQGVERSRGGLGLGLTLARQLVALHHGTVEAHSAGLGHGSTFTVRLPLVDARTTESLAPLSRGPRIARNPRRILLVDDNEDALLLLADALEAAGHQVRTAGDPAEALAVARTFRPEVAILDIGLPVMDGYELAGRLREELQGANVHLIALTGYGAESDKTKSANAGFAAHFVKPVDVQRLSDQIARS